MNPDDTIVAVSSPPGAAWRGIVRLSGPSAHAVAGRCFLPDDAPDVLHQASCRIAGRIRCEGVELPGAMYLFHAPRSYTRQDMAELHLLGATIVLSLLVEACIAEGARPAEPGEFTARAFLSGAMDLSQVHGVAGMIAARSDAQLQAARRLLDGALSRAAHAAREKIAELRALVEGAMDFADEPIEFVTPAQLRDALRDVRAALHSTADAGARAERWGALPTAVLAGAPGVGKSSLFNRLTGLDRAITSASRGTTRDPVSAPLSLVDSECLLVDVAGWDDAAADDPGRIAQRMSRKALREADVILHVLDAERLAADATAFPAIDRLPVGLPDSRVPVLVVLNKCDLVSPRRAAELCGAYRYGHFADAVAVSARTGEGCELLIAAIASALCDRPVDRRDDAVALMAEHREALESAIGFVDRAIHLTVGSAGDAHALAGATLRDADLVAQELRGAATALGILAGTEETEAMLGRIFSRFCVGK